MSVFEHALCFVTNITDKVITEINCFLNNDNDDNTANNNNNNNKNNLYCALHKL